MPQSDGLNYALLNRMPGTQAAGSPSEQQCSAEAVSFLLAWKISQSAASLSISVI